MTNAELQQRVEAIVAQERADLDLGEIGIAVQVADLSYLDADRYGATFGPPPGSPESGR